MKNLDINSLKYARHLFLYAASRPKIREAQDKFTKEVWLSKSEAERTMICDGIRAEIAQELDEKYSYG